MMNSKVSIVVPVYNVEKYLNRCLNSIVNQTYKNIEIIVVDDGSTDSSSKICDLWKSKDERIIVIHKKNKGLGEARNTGLSKASGDYICFIDSDDYILPNNIEKALKTILKTKTEIVLYGVKIINSRGKVTKVELPKVQKEVFINKEIEKYILPNLVAPDPVTGDNIGIYLKATNTMFSMNFIKNNKWKFVSERKIISEDVYSMMQLFTKIKRVAIIKDALYCYCENMKSLSHSYRENRFEMIKTFYNKSIQLLETSNYSLESKERFKYVFVSDVIATMKTIIRLNCKKRKKFELLNNIVKDRESNIIINSYNYSKDGFFRKLFIKALKKQKTICVYIMLRIKCILK